jgi:hypothetical protein
MKLPASIIAGALVPVGLLVPLDAQSPPGSNENRLEKILRKSYLVVSCLTLVSVLCSVMWATVAVNQLTETAVQPAASVWHLIKRDYDLPWAAVNSHFVLGMWGFSFIIGTRSYFNAGGGQLGMSVAGVACSGLLLMVSIVNRGIAAGSGDGIRYGTNVLSLLAQYTTLLLKRASTKGSFGPLELSSVAILVWSLVTAAQAILSRPSKYNAKAKAK